MTYTYNSSKWSSLTSTCRSYTNTCHPVSSPLCITRTNTGTFAESDQLFVDARFWCPGFQELAWHAQLLREPVPEKNTRAELPLRPRRRMSQPEPRRAFPMSAGWDLAFSRPVTGDYPAVVWKCCPDRSRMLFYQRNDSDPELCRRLRKCHSKNSVNLSLAPTQLVQVRSMRASEHSCHSPNSHSDTHRQACMAPIDRLMVGGWVGGGTAAEGLQGTPESGPSLTQRTRSQARSHSNILCDKHYKGDL